MLNCSAMRILLITILTEKGVSEKKTEEKVSVVLYLMKSSNWSYSLVSVCSQWEVKGLKATRSE